MFWLSFYQNIKASPARRNRFILISSLFGLLFNLILWVVLIADFYASSEYIIFQYNVYFGISSLSAWQYVLLLPVTGLAVIIVNTLIAFYLYLKYEILSYFLSAGAVVVNLILLLAGVLIIYINS